MVIIIGAGISGLSLAYHLHQTGVPYTLLESGDRPGGYLQTRIERPYVLELGPNSILADQETFDFLDTIGLSEQIVRHQPVSQNRYIYRKGQYRKLPTGPLSLLSNTFFSLSAKWSVLRELRRKPAQPPENETVAQFFERHFCREIVDYAVAPFVTGIYAGSPHELLMDKVFPKVVDMERQYGSIVKGFAKGGTRRKTSINFRDGLQILPTTLAKGLNIRYQTPATAITGTEQEGWVVHTPGEEMKASHIVLATDAHSAGKLVATTMPALSQALQQTTYVPVAATQLIFKKSQVGHALNGFGGLNPAVENRFAAGSIWASSVFEGKCPDDEVLITTFVGGKGGDDKVALSDEELLQKLLPELQASYQISGEPVKSLIYRWEKAIIQYDKNINPVYELMPEAEQIGIFACANWYQGVSITDSIKKGKTLAEILRAKATLN